MLARRKEKAADKNQSAGECQKTISPRNRIAFGALSFIFVGKFFSGHNFSVIIKINFAMLISNKRGVLHFGREDFLQFLPRLERLVCALKSQFLCLRRKRIAEDAADRNIFPPVFGTSA